MNNKNKLYYDINIKAIINRYIIDKEYFMDRRIK